MANISQMALQMRVSQMLGVGFACSLITPGGITSCVAFVIGVRARSIIKYSGDEIYGLKMAWWCIVAGMIEAAMLLPKTAALIIKAIRT